MNFTGIIVGAATFLIIGICHPIVIKMEYHWGKGSWWLLLLVGLAFAAASIFMKGDVLSTISGAAAFSCFWGILEVFEQEKRVLKGWFPENPARHGYYEAIRRKCEEKSGGSAGLTNRGSAGLTNRGSAGLTNCGSAGLTNRGSAGLTNCGSADPALRQAQRPEGSPGYQPHPPVAEPVEAPDRTVIEQKDNK